MPAAPTRSRRSQAVVLTAATFVTAVAGLGVAGCGGPGGGGGLRVKKLAAATREPSNVALYLSVETKGGDPVGGLSSASFRVFEDGKLVPEKKAKRALLDPKTVEARYTLILADLSGPIVDSEYLPDLVSGIAKVAEAASRDGQVAINVFDGDDEVVPMLGFGAKGGREALEAVRKFRPRSRNSNLRGAIGQSLATIRDQMKGSPAPHRYGTLVVFTDRGDLAGRITPENMKVVLEADPPVSIFVIAAGAGADRGQLEPLARGSFFFSKDAKDLRKGFAEAADKISGASASHYVFSYCSPKRKGEHELEIKVQSADEGSRDSGTLHYKYSADGFGSGCSPKQKPAF